MQRSSTGAQRRDQPWLLLCSLLAIGHAADLQAGSVTVDAGCTLAQAINHANAANGAAIAGPSLGTAGTGSCSGATAGANSIELSPVTLTFTAADNAWYGPNALPPIQSEVVIEGNGARLLAQHVGDPAPSAAAAFRFFYVSGGLEGQLPAGQLSLRNLTLTGGHAKGGDGGNGGGGGAGLGGAIFNQGTLSIEASTLHDNTARGGNCDIGSGGGGGGMGQDAQGSAGGGFGAGWGAGFGGEGGASGGAGGAGGGGFLAAADGLGSGGLAGAAAAGLGGLGGAGGAADPNAGGGAGDGGGGGAALAAGTGGEGGGFGFGGSATAAGNGGGGGGVGGGGAGNAAAGGGGGGFGGGGAGAGSTGFAGSGGFGGGGGQSLIAGSAGSGGFGAGNSSSCDPGAGMGGAIFNHGGTLSLLNVTVTGNRAEGGRNLFSGDRGSGIGAAIFNLNGVVTAQQATVVSNTVDGSNGSPISLLGDSLGGGTAAVYSLAYGNALSNGAANTATLTLGNSLIIGTVAEGGATSLDLVINRVNGAQANSSSLIRSGAVFTGSEADIPNSGGSSSSYPLGVEVLGDYGGLTPTMRPLAADGVQSPTIDNGFGACPATDQRGVARPRGVRCDVGAVEFRLHSLAVTVTGEGEVVASAGSTPLRAGITGCRETVPAGKQGVKGAEVGGEPCNAHYDAETTTPDPVTLTATADAGFEFAGWGGDCAAAGSASEANVTLTADRSCSASFRATSTVALGSSVNPSVFGQSVTLTATVAAAGDSPTGTVTFSDGASPLCTAVALSAGSAVCSTSSLVVGPHAITASYSGDAGHTAATSAVLNQTVGQAATTTSITAVVPARMFLGQAAQVAVAIAANAPGAGTPTGTVTIAGGGAQCTLTLAAGTGSCALQPVAEGSLSLSASYSGDGNFGASSGSGPLQVDPLTVATVTLTAEPATVIAGATIVFSASVVGSTPTGTISFVAGAIVLCADVALVDGMAQCAVNSLAAGQHSVQANYSGDVGNTAASSAGVVVAVSGRQAPAVIPSLGGWSLLVLMLVLPLLAWRSGRGRMS